MQPKMSADDFQTKYASVMESVLKSAVAETTKLFETMVDELKAEISRIKKENEDLKTRCSQFEKGKSQTTVYSREIDRPPRPSDCSEKRDTAVQCDIVPCRTMLVKQCLPLRNASLQNQQEQSSYEEIACGLQEYNFDTHPQMAFIFVKQESILKQEEVELMYVCGKVDNSGLPRATACASENDGTGIIPEKNEELQVALALPCLGMFRGLQRAQNQSSEPQQALVISLTAVNDDKNDETSRGPATSGEKPVTTAQQQPLVAQRTQREAESTSQCIEELLSEPKPQNKVRCKEVKNRIAEARTQPLCRRRALPPKKEKQQQEVKVTLASPSAKQMLGNSPSIIVEDVSSSFITPNNASIDVENIKFGSLVAKVVGLSKESSTVEPKPSQSQQLPTKTPLTQDTQHSYATETLNSTRAESRQAPSIHLRARHTSVTLQDAMLLVEAMNQSPEENTISPSKRSATPPQSQCSAEAAGDVTVSSPQLMSPLKELTFSMAAQTASDEVASVSSQKCHNTTVHKETPKQTESDSDITTKGDTQASLNTGIVPASLSQWEQKLSPTVRLTKLPFSVLVKKSLLVSRDLPNGCAETQRLSKEGTIQEKLLSAHISTQPSDVPVVSTEICTANRTDTVQLTTSATSKGSSEPDSEIIKNQCLAQLAVLPVTGAPKKAFSNDCADTRTPNAETCISGKKLQKDSPVALLRSHIRTQLQTRGAKRNPDLCTEIETTTINPKDPGLENDSPNDKNINTEPISIAPKRPGVVEDVTSLNKTTNDHIPYSPSRTRLCKAAFRQMSVSKPTMSPKAAGETSSSGRRAIGSKITQNHPVSPRRTSSFKDDDRPISTKDGTSPKNTKSTSVSPKRTGSTTEDDHLIKTEYSTVSPASSSENCTSPKMSHHGIIHINPAKSAFTLDSSSTKRTKRTSKSCNPMKKTSSSAIAERKSDTYFLNIRCSQQAQDGESTPNPYPKKTRLMQDCTTPKKNARVLNARKLAKAAKVKTIAKMQKSAKAGQLDCQASCEVLKKYKTLAVWIPPRISATKTPSESRQGPSLLPVKKETRSPKSQNRVSVSTPSISLDPIPVKAPPVKSPFEPLSVIGGRLLKNQCGECGRVLSSSAALESHVSLHTGRRPFSCMLCGKSFPDHKGLKRHSRAHRNGRIHICQECGKGFVYSFGLTKHIQMVHSRIKPFVCQICNKGFFTKRDMEAHIRIHTGEKPFHCNLCDKKFTRRVELNVHLRWHNGEKRHWCPFCGKGFLDFNNLKRHKYIHTGEKPHSCPHCPKYFTQSGHLKKHVKNVHKIQRELDIDVTIL